MTCRGCTPTGCGSSTRSTAPGSSPRLRNDWAVHIALWQRNGAGLPATSDDGEGASPTPRSRCPPSARSTARTPSPRRPPRTEGPLRITASASRPPAVLWRLADQMDIELVRIGSAGAKAMAVVRGRRRCLPACGRAVGMGLGRPRGGAVGRRPARVPAGRITAHLQPPRSVSARPLDVSARARRAAADRDQVGRQKRSRGRTT